MLVISWNINSLPVRMHHVLKILREENPYVLMIQEIRSHEIQDYIEIFKKEGYFFYYNVEKGGRNGVGILSKVLLKQIDNGKSSRFIECWSKEACFICVYVPAGQMCIMNGREEININSYRTKIYFLKSLEKLLIKRAKTSKRLIIGGDFNIVPRKIDAHFYLKGIKDDHKMTCTKTERKAIFSIILKAKLQNCFDLFDYSFFTWYSYRSNIEKMNGLRLDYVLWKNFKLLEVDRLIKYRLYERPSDHVPVSYIFET